MKKQTDKTPADDKKEKQERTPRGKYEEKLSIKGSFLDIMQAAMNDANSKTGKKKEDETE